MYTEEPRKNIDWTNVIKKGLIIILIALIIFFIIWLLTKNNQPQQNVNVNTDNNSSNNNEVIKNPNAYSEIFINNYRYFHDTAKEYFLISELPARGASLKYTLKELIDKGLILPFSYQNGSSCDQEASYVIVTNLNGTYKMTVTLVCGQEVAKTTEELGCNQLCTNGNCNIEVDDNTGKDSDEYDKEYDVVVEYRFKKPYTIHEDVYTCEDGYYKTGEGKDTKCLNTTSEKVAAKLNVEYKCLDGYTPSGTGANMKCISQTNETVNAEKITTYTCENGYTKIGAGANTKCIKTTNKSVKANYLTNYKCPQGYTTHGSGANTTCTKEVTSYVDPNTGCPSGYTNVNGTCVKSTSSYVAATPSCPSGYTLSNNSCVKPYTYSVDAIYSCPQGYTASGTGANMTCTSSTTKTIQPEYTCPDSSYTKSGSGANTKCTKTTTSYVNAEISSYKYSCSKGTLVNTDKCRVYNTKDTYYESPTDKGLYYKGCERQGYVLKEDCTGNKCTEKVYKYLCKKGVAYEDKDATKTPVYKCSNGVKPTSDGKCAKSTTKTVNATAKCSSGTLVNGTCQVTTKNTIKATASCTNGTQPVSGKCYTSTTDTTSVSYTCPNGTLVGTQCRIETTETKPLDKSCQSGQMVNNKCVLTDTIETMPEVTKEYYCDKGFVLDGNVCYQSSNDEKAPQVSTSYSCKNGELKGDKCEITSTETRGSIINKTYSCDAGYTKLGSGSKTYCTKGQVISKNPIVSTKDVTKYEYKWSTEKSIPGWERTGEIKTHKVEKIEK